MIFDINGSFWMQKILLKCWIIIKLCWGLYCLY